jgi:hypothetical protein
VRFAERLQSINNLKICKTVSFAKTLKIIPEKIIYRTSYKKKHRKRRQIMHFNPTKGFCDNIKLLFLRLQLVEPKNDVYTNLSTSPTTPQLDVLSLGGKFIPFPAHDAPDKQILNNYLRFERLLKLRSYFKSDNMPKSTDNILPALKIKSNWTPTFPPDDPFMTDLLTLKYEVCNAIDNLPTLYKHKSKTLSSIKHLRNNNTIRITLADKNLGFCVLDKSHYEQLCLAHLNNITQYKLLEESVEDTLQSIKTNILNSKKMITKDAADLIKYLIYEINLSKIPYFYVLPKIHKKGTLKGRPISAAHTSPTTAISKILQHYLSRILKQIPKTEKYILKNTFELVESIKNIEPEKLKDAYLIVFDIDSLYPNLNLQSFSTLLDQYEDSLYLRNLIYYLNINNVVQFNGKAYHQISGIPMGGNASVEIANLQLHHSLDTKLTSNLKESIILYRRFIDDGFIITTKPEQAITLVKSLLATEKLSLNEDIQISRYNVNFLDIYISKRDGYLTTSIYQKPMNNFLYLPFSSAHPIKTLTGWIKGELIRYKRYTTRREDYETTALLFYNRLLDRCYPRFILDPIFCKNNFTVTTQTTKTDAISLVLPYGKRDLSSIVQAVHKHNDIMFKYTGMAIRTTWSTAKNLSSYLTSSNFDNSPPHGIPPVGGPHACPGTHPKPPTSLIDTSH